MLLELNRLKSMPDDYDPQVFNSLYQKTHQLRNKLARQIDHTRFGVEREDILSAFDVKFIFVFSKHYDMAENVLLGFIINSLQNFKNRILRNAYTQKYSQRVLSVENIIEYDTHLSTAAFSNEVNYFEEFMSFMKEHLSSNAYLILDIKLNPPPYIHHRLNKTPDSNITRVTDDLILEYLEMGTSEKAFKYLGTLKKEIRNVTHFAKQHFNSK